MIARTLEQRAEDALVGGVSAGWNYLLDGPRYFREARGAHVFDTAGQRHIDYMMGWGSLLLGHDPEPLRAALLEVLQGGFLFQYETPLHVELAERIRALAPGAERVRLANSGTEATLHALRIARAATGRAKVIKFEGHFHGLHDGLLFGTDSSPRLGHGRGDGSFEPVAGSAGMPESLGELCLVLPWNSPEALERAVALHRGELAAVILEPIAFNMGCVAPDPGFLEFVRELTAREGIVLIFDEVLTGFRLAPGGAAEYLGVTPDLACYGKALGCGMPIAAVAGRRDLMATISPLGGVEVSGTNTGRILTVAGAIAALREIARPETHARLAALQDLLVRGLRTVLDRHGVPAYVEGHGGRIAVYLGLTERPRDLRAIVAGWDRAYHLECYKAARERGLYGFLNPLPYSPEAITLSTAHSRQDIEETLNVLDTVLARLPYAARAGRLIEEIF